MIEWFWLLVAAVCFFIAGVAALAIVAAGGRSKLENDNMRLRDENAEMKQMNHELRLFNSRQSGERAKGTELQG